MEAQVISRYLEVRKIAVILKKEKEKIMTNKELITKLKK